MKFRCNDANGAWIRTTTKRVYVVVDGIHGDGRFDVVKRTDNVNTALGEARRLRNKGPSVGPCVPAQVRRHCRAGLTGKEVAG